LALREMGRRPLHPVSINWSQTATIPPPDWPGSHTPHDPFEYTCAGTSFDSSSLPIQLVEISCFHEESEEPLVLPACHSKHSPFGENNGPRDDREDEQEEEHD